MVFLTNVLRKYRPFWLLPDPNHFTPDKRAFRKIRMLDLTQKYGGRTQNCYKLARNRWMRTLHVAAQDRKERKYWYRDLHSQRIWAALQEHRFPYKYFLGVLPRVGIELDRRVLAHLGIWEPRTFAALIDICRAHVTENPVGTVSEEVTKPDGVISRDML